MRRALGRLDRLATAKIQGKPVWLRPAMALMSFVGHPVLTASLAFLASLLSFRAGETRLSYTLLLCCVAVLVNGVLKLALRRARPDTHYAKNMWPKTYSFPSGHSFSATVMFGMGAYLAWQQAVPASGLVVAGAIALILAVGYSRVYLGAHYVLDVVAGWLLGLAALLWLIDFAEVV